MEAGYARVSTSKQDKENQVKIIKERYPDVEIYADVLSGDDPSREQYLQMKRAIADGEVDKLVATKLDRLGRSTAEVAELVDMCSDEGVGIHLITQGIDADPDNEMGQIYLKILGVFAEMELNLIRERQREGIERAKENGVQFGKAPYGMVKNDMGIPAPATDGSYEAVQELIREVRRGRPQKPTAEFSGIPVGSIQSILSRSDDYGVSFDKSEWRIERARVMNGEKELEPLGSDD